MAQWEGLRAELMWPYNVDFIKKMAGRNTDDTLQVYVLELADNLCLPNQGVRI